MKITNSKKINEKEFLTLRKNGIFDFSVGNCFPIINIFYVREYFKIKDLRITLDYEINYQTADKKNTQTDHESIILEIKSNKDIDRTIFDETVPFEKLRFSKYCEGLSEEVKMNTKEWLREFRFFGFCIYNHTYRDNLINLCYNYLLGTLRFLLGILYKSFPRRFFCESLP